jgi:hypothetical protein
MTKIPLSDALRQAGASRPSDLTPLDERLIQALTRLPTKRTPRLSVRQGLVLVLVVATTPCLLGTLVTARLIRAWQNVPQVKATWTTPQFTRTIWQQKGAHREEGARDWVVERDGKRYYYDQRLGKVIQTAKRSQRDYINFELLGISERAFLQRFFIFQGIERRNGRILARIGSVRFSLKEPFPWVSKRHGNLWVDIVSGLPSDRYSYYGASPTNAERLHFDYTPFSPEKFAVPTHAYQRVTASHSVSRFLIEPDKWVKSQETWRYKNFRKATDWVIGNGVFSGSPSPPSRAYVTAKWHLDSANTTLTLSNGTYRFFQRYGIEPPKVILKEPRSSEPDTLLVPPLETLTPLPSQLVDGRECQVYQSTENTSTVNTSTVTTESARRETRYFLALDTGLLCRRERWIASGNRPLRLDGYTTYHDDAPQDASFYALPKGVPIVESKPKRR